MTDPAPDPIAEYAPVDVDDAAKEAERLLLATAAYARGDYETVLRVLERHEVDWPAEA